MPDVGKLEAFASLFEIAFELSALLYFFDVRELLERQIKRGLDEVQRIADISESRPDPMKARLEEDIRQYPIPPETREKILGNLNASRNKFSKRMEYYRRKGSTSYRMLALFSSFNCLAVLFYSGLYPEEEMRVFWIVVLLLLAYAFAIRCGLFFLIYVPQMEHILKIARRRAGIEDGP